MDLDKPIGFDEPGPTPFKPKRKRGRQTEEATAENLAPLLQRLLGGFGEAIEGLKASIEKIASKVPSGVIGGGPPRTPRVALPGPLEDPDKRRSFFESIIPRPLLNLFQAVRGIGGAGGVGGAAGVAGAAGEGGAGGIAGLAGAAGAVGSAIPVFTLGIAAVAAVKGITSLAKSSLAAAEALAHISPAQALIFAQAQIRELQRDFRTGEATASTTSFLSDAWQDLKDDLAEIITMFRNIINIVGGLLVELLRLILAPITLISHAFNAFVKWIQDHWPWGDKDKDVPIAFGAWLDEVAKNTQGRRRPRSSDTPGGGDFD